MTVATRSQEFSSEETCNAARARLMTKEMEMSTNSYFTLIRAMCVKK
jgi:hypothetical protein